MKRIIVSMLLGMMFLQGYTDDFIRELPSESLLEKLIPQNFPNMDAVILIKEQSIEIVPNTVYYQGLEISGMSTTYKKVLIAKLFTEAAVERYSDFEYTYNERYGDTFPSTFEVRARILKPDGDVNELPEEAVQTVIARESSSGEPLTRRVVFKIPDLAAGDVLQIEYGFLQNFTTSSSGIYAYNDKDMVLYSNLYITLPVMWNHQFFSFPEDRIGKPKVEQISSRYGAGETYFWSVKNLNPIPDEPFSRPFLDRSMITAFVTSRDKFLVTTWQGITSDYYEDCLEDDDVSDEQLREIGFDPAQLSQPLTIAKADSLYNALRKNLKLVRYNSLYPLSEHVESVFENKEGDASDLAYIYYNILKNHSGTVSAVWVRDKRMGVFEKSVPTRFWFDRMAVLLWLDGAEKLYDFDRGIPNHYHEPWFLNNVEAVVINKDLSSIKPVNKPSKSYRDIYSEKHLLRFDEQMELHDSLAFVFTGLPAEKIREQYYDMLESELLKGLQEKGLKYCLSSIDTVAHNDIFDEGTVRINLCGQPVAQTESIEKMISLKLNNHCVEEFYDRVFRTHQRSDYYFYNPFRIDISWEILLPPGYKVNKEITPKSFSRVDVITAKLKHRSEGNRLSVSLVIDFPREYLSNDYHGSLMALLTDIRKELQEDIILSPVN